MDEGGHVLVATIGKAPAVVTECWEELARSGTAVSRVVVSYTERVKQYFTILELDFKYGEYAGRVNIEGIQIPVQDVSSPEESKTFRKILSKQLNMRRGEAKSIFSFQGVEKPWLWTQP